MAGRKVFQPATVLSATDVNDYLMDQAVMVFGGTAARSSAIGTPTAGMVTYLTDVAKLQVYGTAWADVAPAAVTPSFTSSTATTYTLSTADAGNFLRFTNAATVTVSTATDFPIGQQVQIFNDGTAISFTTNGATLAGAGTSITTGTFVAGARYGAVSIFCVDTDNYRIIGNVSKI